MDFDLSIFDPDESVEFKSRVILSKTFVGTKEKSIKDEDIEKLLKKEASMAKTNTKNPGSNKLANQVLIDINKLFELNKDQIYAAYQGGYNMPPCNDDTL